MRSMETTKAEDIAVELPIPPHRPVAYDLLLQAVQGIFDVFVAMLHPHPQPTEPRQFVETRSRAFCL